MWIFSFLLQKIERVGLAIIGLFSLFLIWRNSRLSKQNETLNSDLQDKSKIIDIQEKVIDVAQNTKSLDLDGNIERMHKGDL